MKRNWENIQKVSCPFTKAALVSCDRSDILPKLMRAFPECFAEGEEDVVPLSEIVKEWNEYMCEGKMTPERQQKLKDAKGGAMEPDSFRLIWGDAFEHPASLYFRGCKYEPSKGKAELLITHDLAEQLERKFKETGLIELTYEGKQWIASNVYNPDGPSNDYHDDPPTVASGYLTLVPKELIAMNL